MGLSFVHYVKKTKKTLHTVCTWKPWELGASKWLLNDSPYWKKTKSKSPYILQLLHIIPSLKISKSRFSIKSMDLHKILHILYGEFLAPYNLHKFSILAAWRSIRFYGENMEIHKGYGDLRYGTDSQLILVILWKNGWMDFHEIFMICQTWCTKCISKQFHAWLDCFTVAHLGRRVSESNIMVK